MIRINKIVSHSLFLSFWLSIVIVFFVNVFDTIDYSALLDILMLVAIVISFTAFFYSRSKKESFKEDLEDYILIQNANSRNEADIVTKFNKKYKMKIRYGVFIHLFFLTFAIILFIYNGERSLSHNIHIIHKKINSLDSLSRDILDSLSTLRSELIPVDHKNNDDSTSIKINIP